MKIFLENCYGIKKLEHKFDFSNGNTKIIYAPNGIMKSSLANTLDDYSKNIESKDRINPNNKTIRNIYDDGENKVDIDSIFVIKPFEQNFKTERISSLLVNPSLKTEYDKIYSEISKESDELIKKLKLSAGFQKDFVSILTASFKKKENDFMDLLLNIEEEINKPENNNYLGIKYNDIFDSKVVNLIKSRDFQKHISEYITKFDELVSNSKIFKKEFNHNNANTIQKQLMDNGYFNANHSLLLNLGEETVQINNSDDLSEKFSEEQSKILNNQELRNAFEKIDKKLTNAQLKSFRNLLLEKQFLLTELNDLNTLRKKVWISYFKQNKEQFNIVVNKYKIGQEKLKEISEKAKAEQTSWEKVVSIFNSRFHVPYIVEIENKEDSIIRDSAPNIIYYFKDRTLDNSLVEEELLWNVLSQGEKRALYLLNIIFEIESRKTLNLKTTFIIDDIADSFDYKNKYAIIEYLKEISNNPLFNMIILTHNFDFLRTVQTRVCEGKEKYHSTFMAIKESDEIILEPWRYKYIENPLNHWKKNLDNESKLIASITFARNLAEYLGDKVSFNKLTALLHVKKDTKNFTIEDLEKVYTTIFSDINDLKVKDKNRKMYDVIIDTAHTIVKVGLERVNLEDKIVISIAIRLLAEEYMIHEINDEAFTSRISKFQTAALFKRLNEITELKEESYKILDRVNIMTPENIHLNSFMFEPLLDLSNQHLIHLFHDVYNLMLNSKNKTNLN